jgi:hypothetical protein
VLAGRLEDAHALAEGALAHAHEHQERGNEAYALRLLGDIAGGRRCEVLCVDRTRIVAGVRQGKPIDFFT